jgi:ankyrin repeat protein
MYLCCYFSVLYFVSCFIVLLPLQLGQDTIDRAFFTAVTNKQLVCAKLLLEDLQANINVTNKEKDNAIIVLLDKHQDEESILPTVDFLLANEIDLQHQNTNGLNTLHVACEKKFFRCVERLLGKGGISLLQTVDLGGSSCLHYAAGCSDANILASLVEKIAGSTDLSPQDRSALLNQTDLVGSFFSFSSLSCCFLSFLVCVRGLMLFSSSFLRTEIRLL